MCIVEIPKGCPIVVPLFLAVVFASVCDATQTDGAPLSIATVGQYHLARTDLGYRIGIARAYGNRGVSDAEALLSLVNDALEREIARRTGIIVTAKELTGFTRHVDASSKAPKVLAAVKTVFDGDVTAYRRIYLAPKMINRELHLWFSRDSKIQEQQRQSIQQAYAFVLSGKPFKEAASASGLTVVERKYEATSKIAPGALKAFYPNGVSSISEGFKKVLNQITIGEILHTIIENDESYRVVRLQGKTGNSYQTTEIISPKRLFEAWYRQQTKSVDIVIEDERLEQTICTIYRQPDWIKKACMR